MPFLDVIWDVYLILVFRLLHELTAHQLLHAFLDVSVDSGFEFASSLFGNSGGKRRISAAKRVSCSIRQCVEW
jgi:hypothetical protein